MILLVGGNGSIGRRYQAILQFMRTPYMVHEANDTETFESKLKKGITKAIIATPTNSHVNFCREFANRSIPFLCEKPLSKNIDEVKWIQTICKKSPGYVVNNYAFLNEGLEPPIHFRYDFYNTGKDGLVWDICQLIYLARKYEAELCVRTNSYWWDMEWGTIQVPYAWIEQSYMRMLRAFLSDKVGLLWSLADALTMTEICKSIETRLNLEGYYEGFDWNPGTDELIAFPWKDFGKNRSEVRP